MSTVTEQRTNTSTGKKNRTETVKNMCMTPPYKTVIQARAKNSKQDEKQNTYEYN